MKKRRFSRTALCMLVLGALMQLAAFWAFQDFDPLLEYAVCAPDVQKFEASGEGEKARVETGLEEMAATREKVEEQLGDGLAALACAGMKAGASVSGNGVDAAATLTAVDGRYLETCPRPVASGRWMDGSEIGRGAKVVVLDADLAFKLFGSEDALNREVRISGADYRVVGTLRHRRSVGEGDEYGAYIPLAAAAGQGIQLDTLTMYALPAVRSGLEQSFRTSMEAAWGSGSLHNLRKAEMGGMMLTRLILFAFGMALMMRLGALLKAWARRVWAAIAARRAREYARSWLPAATLRILGLVACAALWLGLVYGLLCFVIEPVYTFTEWIPESLVEISALKAVFWSRAADAARLVRVSTPNAARAAFWSAAARLGAVLFLLGCALGVRNEKKMKKLAKSGNQSPPAAV